MNKRMLMIIFSLAVAGPAAALTPPTRYGRPCRATSFFIDVPLTEAAMTSAFRTNLQADLRALALANPDWFCATGDPTCMNPVNNANAYVVAVLSARSEPHRTDGHLRFYRAYFTAYGAPYTPLAVRKAAQCEVVQALRNAVRVRTGAQFSPVCSSTMIGGCISDGALTGPDVRVGRECDATAMSAEEEMGAIGSDSERWHRDRLGVGVVPPISLGNTVHFALVDTGIDPLMSPSLGITIDRDYVATAPVPGESTAGLHHHGTKMAILARQIMGATPSLHSFRVLDGQGAATAGALAKGLDRVLFEPTYRDQTLIINTSLGFAPELLRRSLLTDGTTGTNACRTIEDGAGEAVRYVLNVARLRSDEGAQQVSVISSAGNRGTAGSVDGQFFTDQQLGYVPPGGCPVGGPAGAALFAPAEFGRSRSCRLKTGGGFTGTAPLSFPVAGVDQSERPMALALPLGETALVAPAEHVYAAHSSAPSRQDGLVCKVDEVGAPERGRYPAALSGSSVAAALTSAAAARVQAEAILRQGATFDWRSLVRLLYATGDRLCRNNPAGVPVHRLSLANAVAAVSCPTVIDECTSGGSQTADLDLALLGSNDCLNALRACNIPVDACAGAPSELAWPSSLVDAFVCEPWMDPLLCMQPDTCRVNCGACFSSNDKLIDWHLLDLYSLGSLGPVPGDPGGCPDCRARFRPNVGKLDLTLGLSTELAQNTTFENVWVILTNPFGQTISIEVGRETDLAFWKPGAAIIVNIADVEVPGAPANWISADAVLTSDIVPPDREPYHDKSALRYEYSAN